MAEISQKYLKWDYVLQEFFKKALMEQLKKNPSVV
jgi:hypothetical protein